MGETHHQTHQATASRLGLRTTTGGEIVEVQGGHIVRSTGRKDRHSKVCTAKGPRDRRVRLSAHTAIQFYDVQDRLGYDRPSKAVDWLIKKAKSAIDELAELPAWKPTNISSSNFENQQQQMVENEQQNQQQIQMGGGGNSSHENENNNSSSSFLPPSMDSDSIADTIKSFFPIGANSSSGVVNVNSSTAMQFPDLLSRTSSQSQDLRLSLQSFQDPILLHHHNNNNPDPTHQTEQSNIFSGSTTHLSFDGSGWPDNTQIGFQRMVGWGGGNGGDMFSTPSNQTTPFLPPLFGQTQLFSTQRGPLQSNNTPSVRGWIDPTLAFSAPTGSDHNHNYHHHQQQTLAFHPGGGIGFASSGGGFSGFRIPARIRGEEEEHDGISDKPSSASSDSRH